MLIDPITKSQESLTVYENRIVWQYGLIKKSQTVVFLNQITDIKINQSIGGRVAGYGDILVQTAGSSTAEIIAKDVNDPFAFRDLVNKLKQK